MKLIFALLVGTIAFFSAVSSAWADHYAIQAGKCQKFTTDQYANAHAHVQYLQSQGYKLLWEKPLQGEAKHFSFLKQAIASETRRGPASVKKGFEKNILSHTKIEAKLKKKSQYVHVLDVKTEEECHKWLKK